MARDMGRGTGLSLGSSRAESDEMLKRTFVRTADFEILARGASKSFVVGRRGAGKSALFLQLAAEFKGRAKSVVIEILPEEFEVKGLISGVRRLLSTESADVQYGDVRSLMRVVWRAVLLAHTAKSAFGRRGFTGVEQLTACVERAWLRDNPLETAQSILESLPGGDPESLPSLAARYTKLDELERDVRGWSTSEGVTTIVLVDRLDEGWRARAFEVGIIGGLCAAAVDLRDKATNTRALVFLRDNIFRLLEQWDDDFSRNIAGDFLRLTWDHETLFDVVVRRLRVLLNIRGNDSKVHVWNRFAQRELAGMEGFQECLKQTLYRPRDTLELFNRALEAAKRRGRTQIVPDDVSSSALEISNSRLADLYKEYEDVLPGLRSYVQAFAGTRATTRAGDVLQLLEERRASLAPDAQRTFGRLGDASKVFQSLLGVGFLGREVSGSGFQFCHDGTDMPSGELPGDTRVAVHPCYARALEVIVTDADSFDLLLAVNDEYDEDLSNKREVADLVERSSQQLLSELDFVPLGAEGATQFERWVLNVVSFLWADDLSNISLHPNKSAPLRRDVVGANEGRPGLWFRLSRTYGATQVVFEAKNFDTLTPAVFEQARAYLGGAYGRVVFIVYRSTRDTLNENERSHIAQSYTAAQHLVVLLPTQMLQRWLRKGLRQNNQKYAREHFKAWVDKHEREFINPVVGRRL